MLDGSVADVWFGTGGTPAVDGGINPGFGGAGGTQTVIGNKGGGGGSGVSNGGATTILPSVGGISGSRTGGSRVNTGGSGTAGRTAGGGGSTTVRDAGGNVADAPVEMADGCATKSCPANAACVSSNGQGVCVCSDGYLFIGDSCVQPSAQSPTGWQPKLVWTPAQQSIWNRMNQAPRSPWLSYLEEPCKEGFNMLSANLGQDCVMLYQITGDVAWAELALKSFRRVFQETWTLDDTREWFIEVLIAYDWLQPILALPEHAQDRADFLTCLEDLAKAAQWSWTTYRPDLWYQDTDQSLGTYFAVVLAHHYLQAIGVQSEVIRKIYEDPTVGGLDVTGDNYNTLRNTVARYVSLSQGGEFIPGTLYASGDTMIMMTGYLAARTLFGVDHFPEIYAFIQQRGLSFMQSIAGDLRHLYAFGDVDNWYMVEGLVPPERWFTALGMLQGMNQDNAMGPFLTQFIDDMMTVYTEIHQRKNFATNRMLFAYNPFAARADWRQLPKSYFAPGEGLTYVHDGWGADDTFVGFHMRPKREYIDHQVFHFGSFQMYRKGEWVLPNIIYYCGSYNHSEYVNAMVMGGLPAMEETRRAAVPQVADDFAYVEGETSGNFDKADYSKWNPVPNFVQEWTRSFLFLPSGDKRSATVLVHDRADVSDPRQGGAAGETPTWQNYYEGPKARIEEMAAKFSRKQLLFRSPVKPTLDSASAFSWTTAKGQLMRVTSIVPSAPRRIVVDEYARFSADASQSSYQYFTDEGQGFWGYIDDTQLQWQTRLMPADETDDWSTFLTLVQVRDAGVDLTSSAVVQEAGTTVNGVVVGGMGRNDCLAVFNAARGERRLSKGYTISYTAATASTDVFLAHLDPGKSWTASVDGGAAVPLTVSAGGLARFTASGAGTHSLVVQ